ncbi:hypothetical protein DVH05_006922 [Phytophthora capsici]|nr:hypothetical protein DVH05_006922 [Phytophthora capsici]
MDSAFAEDWEALEHQQAYCIEDIAVDSLVDAWDRLVDDELHIEPVDMQDAASVLTTNGYQPLPEDSLQPSSRPHQHASPSGRCLDEHRSSSMQWLLQSTSNPNVSSQQGETSGEQQQIPAEIARSSVPSINEPSAFDRAYMDSLDMQSGLHIVADAKVAKAYRENAEYGLFALFLTATFRHSLLTWTSDVLAARGQPKLTESEFNAYCGLEIAMSICSLSDIAEYWSDSRFLVKQPL